MNMNAREHATQEARREISDSQILSFLRAIRGICKSRATELINQKLDEGESLDSLFYTGYPIGFSLIARQHTESCFEIYFGFLMGFSGGFGNWWKACFDRNGNVSAARMARKTPAREITIQLSRKLISDNRLTQFLRAAGINNPVIAINIINRHLDNGASLDSILYTGEDIGFQLIVEQRTENSFEIGFGCQAGGLAGDSGSWQVAFDEQDQVRSIALRDGSHIVS